MPAQLRLEIAYILARPWLTRWSATTATVVAVTGFVVGYGLLAGLVAYDMGNPETFTRYVLLALLLLVLLVSAVLASALAIVALTRSPVRTPSILLNATLALTLSATMVVSALVVGGLAVFG